MTFENVSANFDGNAIQIRQSYVDCNQIAACVRERATILSDLP